MMKQNSIKWPFSKSVRKFKLIKIISAEELLKEEIGSSKGRRYKIAILKSTGDWKYGFVVAESSKAEEIETFDEKLILRKINHYPFFLNSYEKLGWISFRAREDFNFLLNALKLRSISEYTFLLAKLLKEVLSAEKSKIEILGTSLDKSGSFIKTFGLKRDNLAKYLDKMYDDNENEELQPNIRDISFSIDLEAYNKTIRTRITTNYIILLNSIEPQEMLDFFEKIFPIIPKSRQTFVEEFL